MLWKKVYETPSYLKFFKEPVEKTWSVVFPATADIAVNRACSKSYIAVLEEDEKSKVVNDVQKIVARGEDRVWIDEGAGIFEYPYTARKGNCVTNVGDEMLANCWANIQAAC